MYNAHEMYLNPDTVYMEDIRVQADSRVTGKNKLILGIFTLKGVHIPPWAI